MMPKAFAAALTCVVALAIPLSSLAKPTTLTPAEMRAFGEAALLKGYAAQAVQIAEALLQRDPNDVAALVIKAQALRVMGQLPQSEATARAAWGVVGAPAALRYAAATAVAQALSLQNKRTQAQLWLRRAADVAPTVAIRQQAVQDFEYVQQQNPLRMNFSFSLRPSDNVNGGARDPLFVFRGIPFVLSGDALALSGVSWGVGVNGRYRLDASPTDETALTFALNHQGVVLSNAAKQQAPNAENGDYALDHAEFGFEKLIGADPAPGLPGQWRVATTAGKTWYGGKPLSDDFGAAVGFDRKVKGLSFGVEVSIDKHNRQDNAASSSTNHAISGDLGFRGKAGDVWQVSLNYQNVASQDISVDHRETSLTLGWQAAKPVAGIGIGATLGMKQSDFAASPYSADGRRDFGIRAGLTAVFSKMDYLGFAPVFGVEYARSNSNVALYDTNSLGVSLSIKSQF